MPKFAEAFHVHLVDHRTVQRNAESLVIAPIESVIDYDRFRNAPCVVAEILGQIFVFASDDVTEHLIGPRHLPRDGFRIRVEKEFRAVESQPALRIVRAGNAKTIQLSWPHIGQKHMPDLIGVLGDGNSNVFFGGLNVVEQAKLNRSGCFRKEREVDAVAHPRRAQRIGITKPGLYRSHKRAAHLCGMERALAITNGGVWERRGEREIGLFLPALRLRPCY